jgi:activator-of-BECN1-regulated-autophagy protein 1
MGTHFSPCGRFFVACVACVLPQRDGDHGTQLHEHYDSAGAGTSPTRHTLPSRQIIYELRVYSLEDATLVCLLFFPPSDNLYLAFIANGPIINILLHPYRFGTVLASRAIKAAHCLTSIQVIFLEPLFFGVVLLFYLRGVLV